MRNETRISLPAKPSLTQTTLGQLRVAPRTSRSRQSLGANPESLVAQLALQYSVIYTFHRVLGPIPVILYFEPSLPQGTENIRK